MAFRPRSNRSGFDTTGRRGGPCGAIQDGTGDTVYKMEQEPKVVTVEFPSALPATGFCAFIADDGRAWKVVEINEVHTVIETTAVTSNLKVERCQGTEAVGAGDDLIAATEIDMENVAIDTVQQATVLAASDINILADGDRLMVHAALDDATPTALTEFRGTVQITLVPTTMLDLATS